MKKFLTVFIAVIALFALVSCNGNSGSVDNDILKPEDIDTSKEITVKFYHAMGQNNQAVIEEIGNRFSAEMKELYNVNVKLEQTSYNDYVTLRKTISSNIAAGDQPTIAQTYPDHVATYLEGDAIRALDDYITDPNYGLEGSKADNYGFIDTFWKENTIYDKAGTTYSIPFNKSTEVLFYNKTIFDKYGWSVPTTWDEVVDICEKFKQTTEYQTKTTGASAVPGAGIGIDSEANLFITLLQQYGGKYTGFNSKGEGVYLFDNPQTKEALSWLVSEFNKGNIVTTSYFGTNYCSDAFKNGQCVMTIGSSAGASYNVPTDNSFVTGVAPYPQKAGAPKENQCVIQQGTNVSLFKQADAQEELFGWLFIKYLTNYESALYWTLETAYFPTRKDVAASKEYQEYISQMVYDESGNGKKVYNAVKEVCVVGLGQADKFFTSVAFPGTAQARDEAELIIKGILYSQQDTTIESAIKTALDALKNN